MHQDKARSGTKTNGCQPATCSICFSMLLKPSISVHQRQHGSRMPLPQLHGRGPVARPPIKRPMISSPSACFHAKGRLTLAVSSAEAAFFLEVVRCATSFSSAAKHALCRDYVYRTCDEKVVVKKIGERPKRKKEKDMAVKEAGAGAGTGGRGVLPAFCSQYGRKWQDFSSTWAV